MQQHYGENSMQFYFCNPGQYEVDLSIRISGPQLQQGFLQNGMPQQQQQQHLLAPYGHHQQGYATYNIGGGRSPESTYSETDQSSSSYTSGLSSPGRITSADLWTYPNPTIATFQQMHPYDYDAQQQQQHQQQFNLARYNQSPIAGPSSSSNQNNVKNGNTSSDVPFLKTGTGGCFFGIKKCSII